VLQRLGADLTRGLTEEEVGARQKQYGLNKLQEEKPLSRYEIFLGQFKSPLIYILVVAGTISILLREFTDAAVIFAVVLLNTLVGYFQEYKASRALRELKKIITVEAKVLREGSEIQVNAKNLVPGDIAFLTAGNKVPADGRVLETYSLKVNEAPLTGEWISATKKVEPVAQDISVADRDSMVYMGSMVEGGKGKMVVTGTGLNTEMGTIASLVEESKEEKTPLQKRLTHFSRFVGILITLIVVLIFFAGIIQQRPFLEMFKTSIAVAVAAIPEGLPIAMTIILALGMARILRRKGLVRKLVAAETLGNTSIACTDKTLTLTEGKMEVAKTFTLDTTLPEKGNTWVEDFQKKKDRTQIFTLTIAALVSEAFVENPEDLLPRWRVRGSPTDTALLLAGAAVNLKKPELEKEYQKIDEIPFNTQNKFIASLRKHGKRHVLFISGAPERILDIAKSVQTGGASKVLTIQTKHKLIQELEGLTGAGLRVIGVGYRNYGEKKPEYQKLENLCGELTFVGFIALHDPIRPEAREAVRIGRKAGIRSIIVTGDHARTAQAVARELGLKAQRENIIEGKELDDLNEEQFQKRLPKIEVYARVEPRHKMRIVQAWQARGEVVAMTGDGINDAPALKQADIGVALGSGTDVAKEVSDLVLLTDNFNIIPAAIEEGRGIMDNIRKVITYLLSDSFTETILIGVSIMFGLPLPVTAVQILWVNLIENGLPGIALAFEPKEKEIMQRKPEKKTAPLLTAEMKFIIVVIGISTDLILLGIFFWLLGGDHPLPYIQTIVFAALGSNSLFYVFSCKNLRKNLWHINLFSNKFLVFSVLIGFLALFASVHVPLFQTFLKTVPLGVFEWSIIIGFGIVNIIAIEAAKWYFIRKHKTEA